MGEVKMGEVKVDEKRKGHGEDGACWGRAWLDKDKTVYG
jgi:hypothetical protein